MTSSVALSMSSDKGGKLVLFLVVKEMHFAIEYNICSKFFGDSIYHIKETSLIVTDFT